MHRAPHGYAIDQKVNDEGRDEADTNGRNQLLQLLMIEFLDCNAERSLIQ